MAACQHARLAFPCSPWLQHLLASSYMYCASDAGHALLSCSAVQVANRSCQGRIVSVLEGGYRIRGGMISAFARSVAAHVGGLTSGSLQVRVLMLPLPCQLCYLD